MKKAILLLIFLILTPITLGISLFALAHLYPFNRVKVLSAETSALPGQIYAALPAEVGSIDAEIETDDARPVILDQYLGRYNSPMTPYADFLFEMSEKYGLDYRLMVAIAQCESNLCKKAPAGSYNCWGFENGETKFSSWQQAIEQVAKTLKERYIDQGLVTPEQIMPKYAPPSVEKGGPWAKCVNQFLQEIEELPW
jgi:hypothetical protein